MKAAFMTIAFLLAFSFIYYSNSYGSPFYSSSYYGNSLYNSFYGMPYNSYGGFNVYGQPAFVGSVLHPATFYGLATSTWTTMPTYYAWNSYMTPSAFYGGYW